MRGFIRRHPFLIAFVALVVCGAVLIAWEMGYECVRWSTRIDVTDKGGVIMRKVCAETRPRWGENIGK